MNGITYPPPPPRPTVASVFPSSPPPRPSSVNERPSAPRPPVRQRTITLRWDAIVTVIVALVVGIVIGMAVQWQVSMNVDPWHGVPACTDQIADAGGICHGEPQ